MQAMRTAELARMLQAELRGDPDTEITGVAGIEGAGPGQVTFVANPRYAGLAKSTRATAILVVPDFPDVPAITLRLKNPYLGFAQAIEIFYQPPLWPEGIHPSAAIHPTAKIGAHAHIGPYAVIGENVTFQGPEAYVRSQGVKLEILNDPACIQLMRDFIKARPELWNEDIGV